MERLNAVEAHLTQNGFSRVGPAVRNPNLAAGALTAYAINAQAGQCYVPVAVGASSGNLDMIVVDPMGQNVAHNVQPDANPWVRFCAQSSGRYIARMQMSSGGGEYFYALYQGSGEPALATVLGGAVEQAQQTVAVDSATQSRLQEIDRRLSGERFERVSEPLGVMLTQREETRRGLNLQAGTCYAFASLGGDGTTDTDIFILNSEEEIMIQDNETDRDGVVQFCPPTTGSYVLRAQLWSGEGPLFTVAYQQGASTNANTNDVMATNTTATRSLDESYALLDADIRARGYEAYGEAARGQLAQGGERNINVTLDGGKCYAIVAIGESSVRNLDLIVRDSGGSIVDRDVSTDARPIIRVCAGESGTYQMKISMAEGAGNFAYQAYRWPRGTRGPFGLSGLIYVRLGEVTSLLQVEGYEPDGNFAPGRGNLRREGGSAHHDLELPAGQCFSILTVGGDGVNDIDLRLSQNGQQLAADGTRNGFPTARYCTQTAGTYRLDVTATAGHGAYFYQVFSRSN